MSTGDDEARDTDETIAPGRARVWIGAAGAPLAFLVLWFAPLPLEEPAHRLAAIFGAVLTLWVTEVIPIAATALLIAPLLVVCGVSTPKESFKHYADPLLYLFVGGFFIAEAMRKHGLDRRIAKAIVGTPWVNGRPARVRLAMIAAGALLSMWISNTAATAILVPILMGMVGRRGEPRGATGSLLAVAYACSAGGLGTLVGSPPNLITVRLLEEGGASIGFLGWMVVGLPTAALVCLAIYLTARLMFPPASVAEPPERGTEGGSYREPPPPVAAFDDVPPAWRRGEIATAVSFGLAVLGWTLPGILQATGLALPDALDRLLDPGIVALLAASILFAVPDGTGPRVLAWRDATRIDWGIILLFGGGIALGTQLVQTGLAAAMSEGFVALTGIRELWAFTALCCLFTIFFTEICSNTATANMLVPLVVGVAVELGVSPIPPALAVGLAASCAFMLPIATGPNAIVYSTGRVSQPQMIRAGLVLNLVSVGIVFAVLRVLCPLFGWA